MSTDVLMRMHEIGGSHLVNAMIDLHVERCQKKCREIEDACKRQAAPDVVARCQELRRFCQEVGTDTLDTTLGDLEYAARRGTLEAAAHLMSSLRDALHHVTHRLQAAKSGNA